MSSRDGCRIVQLVFGPENSTWQGTLLGLGSDGTVYELNVAGNEWMKLIETPNGTELWSDAAKGNHK